MLDVNAELRGLVDALREAGVEFTITGPLANSFRRGEGIQKSIDLLVWPENRERAESVAARRGFQRAGRPRSASAGRYNLQRFVKTSEMDILALTLVVPASLVTAALVGQCAAHVWQGRTVRVAGSTSIDPMKQEADSSLRRLTLLDLPLFWPDEETWAERDLGRRFEDIEAAPERATSGDVEALLVGLRRRCVLGRRPETIRLVQDLSVGVAEQSPALDAYLRVLRSAGNWGDLRCYFRNTLAGLQWA
jgi:hypothetical protein